MNVRRTVVGIASFAVAMFAFWPLETMAETPLVANTSYTAGSERVMRHEVIVDASVDEAWQAFSTAEGWQSFAVPVVEFELKMGGKFHSNYNVGSKLGDPGTIYHSVLCYVPRKMIAFKIGLTDEFPAGPRQAGTLFTIVEIEPTPGPKKTRVILSMLGWGTGAEWEQVYKHFEWGNPYTLNNLRERFISGPLNWQEIARKNSMKEK